MLVRVYVCYNEEEKEKVEASGLPGGLERQRREEGSKKREGAK